jgi:hypothetical protein
MMRHQQQTRSWNCDKVPPVFPTWPPPSSDADQKRSQWLRQLNQRTAWHQLCPPTITKSTPIQRSETARASKSRFCTNAGVEAPAAELTRPGQVHPGQHPERQMTSNITTTRPNKPNALGRLLQFLTTAFARLRSPKQITTVPETYQPAPSQQDDAEFCSHPRHGAFPVRRKFKAHGTSAAGHRFLVFQCPVPACGEFVAKTKDLFTGRERILFRGHHFQPRQTGGTGAATAAANLTVRRQPRMPAALRGATLILPFTLALLLVGTGCSRKSYFVELKDQEAITLDSDVFLDGKTIGTVTEITRKGESPVRAAKFVVTVPGIELRAGVEREQPGGMRLSSASCNPNARVLESGSTLPTRSPITNVAKSTVQSVRDFFYRFRALHPTALIAVGLIAAALVILIALRLIRKVLYCLLVLTALTWALCAANAAPVKRQEVEAEIREVETLVTQAEEHAAQARRLAKAGLFLPAQIAGVRAEFACDRTAYAETKNLGNVDRLSTWTRAETKAVFRSRYHDASQRRARVEDAVADVAPTATKTDERLIALYLSQREPIKSRIREGKLNDDQLLKDLSALARFPATLIQQKLLTIDNVSEVKLDGTNIRLPNGQILSLGTDSNPATKPTDAPKPSTIVTQVVPVTAQADISMQLGLLRQQQSNIQADISIIKTNRPLATPPGTRSVSVHRDNPTLNKAGPPLMSVRPTVTNNMAEKVAMTNGPNTAAQSSTRRLAADIAVAVPTNAESGTLLTKSSIAAAPPAHTNNAPGKTATLEEPSDTTRTNASVVQSGAIDRGQSGGTTRLTETASSMRRVQALVAILIVGVMVVFLAVFFGMRIRDDEPFVITLRVDGREREFDLEAGRDAVFLGTEVFCAEQNSPHPCPRLTIKRKGAILHPPRGGPSAEGNIRVNGTPVSNPCVLQPGDVITLARANQPDQSIKFLSYAEAVPGVDEAEMQFAPTNPTQ